MENQAKTEVTGRKIAKKFNKFHTREQTIDQKFNIICSAVSSGYHIFIRIEEGSIFGCRTPQILMDP